ncbi:MAG: class I SAM-dependent methyltransferase [Endomicrobium sp.]|nr:class I SAM-dependent methyltransferase [Endomicrobium sp.]
MVLQKEKLNRLFTKIKRCLSCFCKETVKYLIKVKNIKSILFLPEGCSRSSALANKYLKGLRGIEIGGSSYNDFFLNTINIDCDVNPIQHKYGEIVKVDIIAEGDNLPFKDNIFDFVLTSHVLEHMWDPIKTLNEWIRVIKPNGYVFMIIPHKERTFDKPRQRTSLNELIKRHECKDPLTRTHYNVWITEDVLELCRYLNLNVIDFQDKDDKIGNGFTIVIKK